VYHDSLPSGRAFRADIPLSTERIPEQSSDILLARQAPNGALYIIERAGDGMFIACRLCSWVREDSFAAKAEFLPGAKLLEGLGGDNVPSTSHAHPKLAAGDAIGLDTVSRTPKRPKNRRGVLARMLILPKAENEGSSRSQSIAESQPVQNTTPAQCTAVESSSDETINTSCLPKETSTPADVEGQPPNANRNSSGATVLSVPTPQSSDELFQSLRKILLQALYTPKIALAHFTKSTLARARATFRSSTTTSTTALADFYRNSLISSKKMDLKYRDTIPKIIDAALLQESPGKGNGRSPFVARTRKPSKRKKLGKDGLFPGEDVLIRMWWLNRDVVKNEDPSHQPREREMRDALAELRNRETQIQIILILEVVALESVREVETPQTLPAIMVKEEPNDDSSKHDLAKVPLKASKKQDLKSNLDVLVDRLCIFESVGIPGMATTGEAEVNNKPEPRKRSRDKLREFCCNIIAPFYFGKTPELVTEISRKLGGPNMSLIKPVPSLGTTPLSRTKPGEAIDSSRRSIPRRTLERVLSEEQSSRQQSPPVLMRSSTMPSTGQRSRESTEPPQRPCSRGTLQRSHSFSNREVDLVASNEAQETKRKKLVNLAKQKEELSAAIQALRKPNRNLVGKEIMAEVEKRSAERNSIQGRRLSRSPSNPALGIEIAATPKKVMKSSKMDAIDAEQSEVGGRSIEQLAIPSSTLRPTYLNGAKERTRPHSALTKRAILSTVHETPSRGNTKLSNPLSIPSGNHPQLAPASQRKAILLTDYPVIQATPTTNGLRPDHANLSPIASTPLKMSKSQRPVLFTPLKRTEVPFESAFRNAPVVTENASKAMERVMTSKGPGEASIYDSLGWDDDVDELQ
jgi:DNA replication regulator SLD3